MTLYSVLLKGGRMHYFTSAAAMIVLCKHGEKYGVNPLSFLAYFQLMLWNLLTDLAFDVLLKTDRKAPLRP